MRGVRATAVRLLVLALALAGLLGAECDEGFDETFVALVPDAESVGTLSQLVVEIAVASDTPIQAFELGLRWDPEMLAAVNVFPHPEFDDDGAFFTNPLPDLPLGTLDRIVDLRHGGEGARDTFKIATVYFLTLSETGSTSIELTSAGLAHGDGSEPPVTMLPVTITIEP